MKQINSILRQSRSIVTALIIVCCAVLYHSQAFAISFPLPENGDNVVGQVQVVYSEPGDTLAKIGKRHDIGYFEMIEANQDTRRGYLKPWTRVVIPSSFILPDAPHEGIVINVAELRLFYYPPGENRVITYPLGIGRLGWATPTGKTTIIGKEVDPTWHVPKSIKAHVLETKGIELPDTVPPGPENPLGRYAMRLGFHGYLLHSTNQPETIGQRASSGCIRMLPDHAEWLYHQVKVGTVVQVVNQPYKLGWSGGQAYIEAHLPLQEDPNRYEEASVIADGLKQQALDKQVKIDWMLVHEIIGQNTGYPRYVGTRY